MIEKKLLKETAIKRRNELAGKEEKSQIICEKLLLSNSFKQAKTIFVYLSCRSEVYTQKIVEECFASGKTVCVPVCKKDCQMDAVTIEDMSNLVYNNFGILEPIDKTKIADKKTIDLCIAPGSVFDRSLNRIGYGKGFYDRFLQGTGIKTIALAFDCQIEERIPFGEYDVKMDCIITEKEVLGVL